MHTFCFGWRPRFTWQTWTSSSVQRFHQSQTQFYCQLSRNRWSTPTLRPVWKGQSAKRSSPKPSHHLQSWTMMGIPAIREEVLKMVATHLRWRKGRKSSQLTTLGLCHIVHSCQEHFSVTSMWNIAAPSSPSNMSANMSWRWGLFNFVRLFPWPF